MVPKSVAEFNSKLDSNDQAICDRLAAEISLGLPEAEGKVWHGHPVWFLAGNPIVGYTKLKEGLRLMFWSGASFEEPELTPAGSFKMAVTHFNHVDEISSESLAIWLEKGRRIQWDYKNIRKNKGGLSLLTE